MTSEFLAYVGVLVALVIATASDDDLGATTLWILITVLTFGYMLSRGLSKTASRRRRDGGGAGGY